MMEMRERKMKIVKRKLIKRGPKEKKNKRI